MKNTIMLYKSRFGNINFWDPYPNLNNFKNIGINLSGGCDSALLMYMTCRELNKKESDANIVPITGVHNLRPTNEWNAREIVDYFKELFPKVKFKKHQINYYDKQHEKDKTNQHLKHEIQLRDNKIIDVLFHGRTANPNKQEAKNNNLLYKREEKRDKHGHERVVYHERHNRPFYCPMEIVDKRFVAAQYKKFRLMKELFPITASCVGYAKETDYFTKPCKVCWWCREKKWAFKMYDGEHV